MASVCTFLKEAVLPFHTTPLFDSPPPLLLSASYLDKCHQVIAICGFRSQAEGGVHHGVLPGVCAGPCHFLWRITLVDNALIFTEDTTLLPSWSALTVAGDKSTFRVPYSIITLGIINYS